MAQRVMRICNGVRLIEATLVGYAPPRILSRTYSVKRLAIRKPLFVGTNLVEAEAALRSAARQFGRRPVAVMASDAAHEDDSSGN